MSDQNSNVNETPDYQKLYESDKVFGWLVGIAFAILLLVAAVAYGEGSAYPVLRDFARATARALSMAFFVGLVLWALIGLGMIVRENLSKS